MVEPEKFVLSEEVCALESAGDSSMQTAQETVTPLRIVVVEDDDLVRGALTLTLEKTLGHQVVGQANNGLDMVEVVLTTEPDLVIFDIHLPEMNGLDALKR